MTYDFDREKGIEESLEAQNAGTRCAVCGWPLAKTREEGCAIGDCSMRPLPARAFDPRRANAEYGQKRWQEL